MPSWESGIPTVLNMGGHTGDLEVSVGTYPSPPVFPFLPFYPNTIRIFTRLGLNRGDKFGRSKSRDLGVERKDRSYGKGED